MRSWILGAAMLLVLGGSQVDRYPYLDKCNTGKMKATGANTMLVVYDCATGSDNYEKKTVTMYKAGADGSITLSQPFVYGLMERDGSFTYYSDPAMDGWNGNEKVEPRPASNEMAG